MKTLVLKSGLAISSLLLSCRRFGGHMRDGYGNMDGYGHMMNFSYGGIFMWIIIVLVIGLIGFGAYFLNKKGNILQSETPIDILKKRYAKGEITKDELEEMKKNL
jgi:putative membrane protein